MPLYEYRCTKCDARVEVIQKFSDKPKTKCEECGGKLEKLLSASGFILKGAGWYKTDYAPGKGKKAKQEGSGSEPAKAPETKSEKPAGDKGGSSGGD